MLVVCLAATEPALLADVEAVPVVCLEAVVAVVEPVPSPVPRTVWPEVDVLVEEVLLAALVVWALVLAAGVVTFELEEVLLAEVVVVVVVEEDPDDVVRACAEASNWKATRDRAAAAIVTISIILFIARLVFICKYNTFSQERGTFPRLSSKNRTYLRPSDGPQNSF